MFYFYTGNSSDEESELEIDLTNMDDLSSELDITNHIEFSADSYSNHVEDSNHISDTDSWNNVNSNHVNTNNRKTAACSELNTKLTKLLFKELKKPGKSKFYGTNLL